MFNSARFKLTAWYLLIIMVISICFSLVVYKLLTNEVERFAAMQRFRIERRIRSGAYVTPDGQVIVPKVSMPPFDPDLVLETDHRIAVILAIINAGIFIFAGGLGYFLAGRTLRPIQIMMDEQNRFIGDASHEFRTPLTSIKSAMEVNLRDKHLTMAEARSLLEHSIDQVNKLQSLSDGLLQLAQLQKPNGMVKFENVSIAKVVSEAIDKTAPFAKEKNITVENTVEERHVEGSFSSLNDLFSILLDNAIKYSPAGSVIRISSKKTAGYMDLYVKDEGIGIAQKDIAHIFDRFYRADTTRSTENVSGYGLGLSIAKGIVKMHHGTITVASELKKGTTFTVRLPRKQKKTEKTK